MDPINPDQPAIDQLDTNIAFESTIDDINTQIDILRLNHHDIVNRAFNYVYLRPLPKYTFSYWLERCTQISSWFDPIFKPSSCVISSAAIMDLNPYNHKYIKSTTNIDSMRSELSNDEPGCFRFHIDFGTYIISWGNRRMINTEIPLAHSFIILKHVKNDSGHIVRRYQIVQSYIDKYFLQFDKIYDNFDDFDDKVLAPLIRYQNMNLSTGSIWLDFSKFWKYLTDVNIEQDTYSGSRKIDIILTRPSNRLGLERTTNNWSIYNTDTKTIFAIGTTILLAGELCFVGNLLYKKFF